MIKGYLILIDRCYFVFFFFFFQAEDGIRDLTVTGVQTCALPISGAPRSWGAAVSAVAASASASVFSCTKLFVATLPQGRRFPVSRARLASRERRSEERRVGEEGRSRWSPDHLKKKKKKVSRSEVR